MFLDSEPEVIYPAIESNAFGLPLMARKRTATLLYSTEEVLTVLEFFAVGDLSTAVLLRAVKGGVNLPQTNISAIFKVHLSLFLIAQFFITQLTLPCCVSNIANKFVKNVNLSVSYKVKKEFALIT